MSDQSKPRCAKCNDFGFIIRAGGIEEECPACHNRWLLAHFTIKSIKKSKT